MAVDRDPVLPADHVCRCINCAPDLYPAQDTPRLSDQHYAVRLGDGPIVASVTVDGRRVRAFEAMAGEDGWVLSYSDIGGHLHRCTCRDGACSEMVSGHVEVTIKPTVLV